MLRLLGAYLNSYLETNALCPSCMDFQPQCGKLESGWRHGRPVEVQFGNPRLMGFRLGWASCVG